MRRYILIHLVTLALAGRHGMRKGTTTLRSIVTPSVALIAITMALFVGGYGYFASHGSTVAAQTAGPLQGYGIVTGTVTAGKPFKAAHVYLRSLDKPRRNMLYMVY